MPLTHLTPEQELERLRFENKLLRDALKLCYDSEKQKELEDLVEQDWKMRHQQPKASRIAKLASLILGVWNCHELSSPDL